MKNLVRIFLHVLLSTAVAGVCAGIVVILYTNAKLPSVDILEDIQLQVPLRIFTSDGKLIAEYGEKRRIPVSIDKIPDQLKLAVLATEDRRFYEHHGIDFRGLVRASLHLLTHGNKGQGASTITMQVARNFFLTRKKTFSRKINEMLLALKIEKELSKDKILELYLNKIYFGKRAYGVAAAAEVYYGTTIDQLTLPQMAMLAGLPQAPSAINPLNNPQGALKRRNHVLSRMYHYGFINETAYKVAINAPLNASFHHRKAEVNAPYVAEMARQALLQKFGPSVYTLGIEAYTTVDSNLQQIAQDALQLGLIDYDRRHGYRGAIQKIDLSTSPEEQIRQLKAIPIPARLMPALILKVSENAVIALLPNEQRITIPFDGMKWARKPLENRKLGSAPQSPHDVVAPGDVIYAKAGHNTWELGQIPAIGGAFVALSPQDGAIKALVGGYDFYLSSFNRATQALRQPGSNFKPFIYAAALEQGFTAASVMNDAPVVFQDAQLQTLWRPQNDNQRFYGPTRLRVGLAKSRNLVSIRLLQSMGMRNALKVLERFGFERSSLPNGLSLALGTIEVHPIDIAAGYATFANGGFRVNPYIIDRIEDTSKRVLSQTTPTESERVISEQTAYIMTSMLQDAIQMGTGQRAKSLNRPDLAGKTGTTNKKMDAWYTGYNQDLVATAWVGFDDSKSTEEYGSQAALPIWMQFMQGALQGTAPKPFVQPPGLVTVRIDPSTGMLARSGQANAIFEVFTQDTVPGRIAPLQAPKGSVSITPNAGNSEESLF